MNSVEVGKELDRIWEGISLAIRCWEIRMNLWETDEVIDTLNHYKGFFVPVRSALQRTAILEFAKLIDYHPKSVSLTNLLKRLKGDPRCFGIEMEPNEVQCLRKELSTHKDLMRIIMKLRNQYISHSDVNQDLPVLEGEINIGTIEKWEAFIGALREIHAKLAYAHDQSIYQPDFDRTVEDTKAILARLGGSEG